MRKPKVLILGKLPPPYIGPAVATHIIINSKLNEYFEINHLDLSHHKSLDQLGKVNLKNLIYPFKIYTIMLWKLLTFRPVLVYMPSQQFTVPYLREIPLVMMCKVFSTKIVCHLRGSNFLNWYHDECGPRMQKAVQKTQRRLDAQIVLGENLKYLFTPFMDEEKIHVVANAADYTYPDKKPSSKTRVLYLGNFLKAKGIFDVIEVAKKLIHVEELEFVCAGNFPLESDKQEILAQEKGLKNLTIINSVVGEDKFALLKSADIFLFPSYNEGHPWVIVEAIGAGLPIISTDKGAIIQNVKHGENGFIVDVQSPEQISKHVLTLVKDPELRQRMSEASKTLYENEFREKNLVENLKKVFDHVLAE